MHQSDALTLSYNTILALSKLKASTDKNSKVAQMMKFVSDGIESIVGKGENAGYQHFLLFLQSFQNAPLSGLLKFAIA